MKLFTISARKPWAFKPGDEWPPGGSGFVVAGPEEILACSGPASLPIRGPYQASTSVPRGVCARARNSRARACRSPEAAGFSPRSGFTG